MENITNGKIQLDGGTLTDASNLTIGAGATLTGFGKVNANIPTSVGTITATGGTLELNGTVASTTGGLHIGSASGDTLKLDGANCDVCDILRHGRDAGAQHCRKSDAHECADTRANTLKLDAAAGATQLTDAAGLTLAGGSIVGSGSVAANTNISGFGTVAVPISTAGTITASGGTLDLTGTVSGRTLVIGTTLGSDLKIDGTTTSAAITINNANQTLEIGVAGALTITGVESITNGKIQLDGGTLTDASNLTIGAGATLTGFGKVNANIPTSVGTITATGGTLELNGTVASTTGGLHIGSASGDTLKLDGISTATSVAFSGTAGTLELNTAATVTLTNALAIGANTVKLDAAGTTLTDLAGLSLSSGGKIIGVGVVNGVISGTGTIEGTGGTLTVANNLTSSTLLLEADSAPLSTLALGGTVAATRLHLSQHGRHIQRDAAAVECDRSVVIRHQRPDQRHARGDRRRRNADRRVWIWGRWPSTLLARPTS